MASHYAPLQTERLAQVRQMSPEEVTGIVLAIRGARTLPRLDYHFERHGHEFGAALVAGGDTNGRAVELRGAVAMATTVGSLLEKYRRYLTVMDEWAEKWEGDRSDLLSPGEVFDVLWIRDQLESASLSASRRRELEQLDDLLMKYREVIVENIPPRTQVPRSHWWWYLDEGPQVREQALAAKERTG